MESGVLFIKFDIRRLNINDTFFFIPFASNGNVQRGINYSTGREHLGLEIDIRCDDTSRCFILPLLSSFTLGGREVGVRGGRFGFCGGDDHDE